MYNIGKNTATLNKQNKAATIIIPWKHKRSSRDVRVWATKSPGNVRHSQSIEGVSMLCPYLGISSGHTYSPWHWWWSFCDVHASHAHVFYCKMHECHWCLSLQEFVHHCRWFYCSHTHSYKHFYLIQIQNSEKKTSFLCLIHTHTYTQKLIHKTERNYDRFCFGLQWTFHLFLFLQSHNFSVFFIKKT